MSVPEVQHVHPAKVVRWVDGDTVILFVNTDYRHYAQITHRLVWIDAPEKRTAAGKIAWAHVQEVLPVDTKIVIRSYQIEGDDEDNFGRYLAEIFYNGESFNQRLLMDGYAVPYDPTKKKTTTKR